MFVTLLALHSRRGARRITCQTLTRRDAEVPWSVLSPRQKLLSNSGTQSKTPGSPNVIR